MSKIITPAPPAAPAAIIVSQGNRLNSDGTLSHNVAGRGSFPFVQTLPAAGSPGATLTWPLAGHYFYVYASTGPLLIQPNNGNQISYDQGTGEDQGSNNPFNKLTISNPSNKAVTFTLVVGYDSFIDKRLVIAPGVGNLPVVNPSTKCIAQPKTVGAHYNNGFLDVGFSLPAPGNANGGFRRKTAIFTNDDSINKQELFVIDSNNNYMANLLYGQTKAFETDDVIALLNPLGNANAALCWVSEIYYNS